MPFGVIVRAEDVELVFRLERLGCEFVFNPAAAGLHYATRSYRSWIGAGYQYGRNDIVFGKGEERAAGQFRYRHPLTRALVHWAVRWYWLWCRCSVVPIPYWARQPRSCDSTVSLRQRTRSRRPTRG